MRNKDKIVGATLSREEWEEEVFGPRVDHDHSNDTSEDPNTDNEDTENKG